MLRRLIVVAVEPQVVEEVVAVEGDLLGEGEVGVGSLVVVVLVVVGVQVVVVVVVVEGVM